ncbi:D-hexose-6-phosphate mutarotase [Marinomonas primoryensis]|jgi:glucose-6-phosphate 1-epimerase|uniref:Putative glucose-6-phosphate 1-epimerase n=1 Tax=Marinomonas primoryensis TaxID=178399 RepID=A0A2Z4PMH1_9GAMM|nr:D-hexose-6-phosphate mutarotase [Marinomonas primoryensis]AWX98642.1 D-hexose-6-phosphate mutarotase [Marinomonas primoryensis]QKK82133.1 D-hexose-6-phosphate mutarotase [Marinomonas primoryensis]|tara:strand:- start:16706 stop:17626 length:921 start_codon:yes stop_codon:yes gene_type:complete
MNGRLMQELEELGGEIRPASLKKCDEIIIDQPGFSAIIALWGGHLESFVPAGQEDLLFQSTNQGGEGRFARRHFGVPVCWPWFGAHDMQSDYPAHGLARYFRWEFIEAGHFKNGDVKIVIRLASEDHPLIEEMWPFAFELRQVFRFSSKGFRVNFSAANLSDKPMPISEALHTYFNVSDNQTAEVHGLDQVSYVDKFDNGSRQLQQGVVTPCGPIDRVYLSAPDVCEIQDPGFQRKLIIQTEGSNSTVLWNPGADIAKQRTDMEDGDYRCFVCVEAANALSNAYEIAPGEIHQLKLKVKYKPLFDE